MNFVLYPIYWLPGSVDDERFDLSKLPFDVAEGVQIEDVSNRFAQGTFDLFKEKLGTERLDDLKNVQYALVHRYLDPTGYPQDGHSEQTVLMLAACLRLIRPMRQNALLMRGGIRTGMFDVNHFELPAPHLVEVPEVQKLFKLRNCDA